MAAVLNGLQQRGTPPPTASRLERLGFTRLDCEQQHALVDLARRQSGPARDRRDGLYVRRHFDAWYDGNCTRRSVPKPLPWAQCAGETPFQRSHSWALDWC